MSFQNTVTNEGISVNVIPSFGRIVQLPENQRQTLIQDVLAWRNRKVLSEPPVGFNPARYRSFNYVQQVENPVDHEHIHEYVERSRLIRRNL